MLSPQKRKENTMKKLLICLMVMCLLVPFFSACQGGQDEDKTVQRDETLTVEPVDLNGDTINVLCRDFGAGTKSILGYTGEIIYSEDNPSTVDEAKREVVEYMEGVYNCNIEGLKTTDDISQTISNQISAGLRDYDIYFDSFRNSAQMALAGYTLDLNSVPNINLKDEWWDQNAVEDLSVNGKLFFVCGDINTYDDQGTWCMLFNKNLKSELTSLADINFYELASSGKWTFDKFKEICIESGATSEINGDGVQDEKDRWAFGTETYNIYVHAVAAGYKIAQKNKTTDLPYLTISEEQAGTYKVLQDVTEFYNSKDVMVANSDEFIAKFPNGDVWEQTVHKAFTEGRELFYMCGLINVASFRQMEDEFGILPVPKGSSNQDRYYHTVSIDHSSFMFLPINIKNDELEKLGTFISGISELSKKKVTYEYREVQLKYRDARDSESEEMLEIIFGSRVFDLGCAYNWGGILEKYMSLDGNPASNFAGIKLKAETEMKQTIEKLKLAK